jgi:hypothetical protein
MLEDARRKDAYEALHPETKYESFKGNQHASRQVGDNQIADRVTADTAAKTGSVRARPTFIDRARKRE